jgi:hypothetical protein
MSLATLLKLMPVPHSFENRNSQIGREIMAQLTIQDIFGSSATVDFLSGFIKISISELAITGLNEANGDKGIAILAAILKKAFSIINPNTDESINASASLSISSPSLRDGVEKTLHEYIFSFYAPYSTPALDPDDL